MKKTLITLLAFSILLTSCSSGEVVEIKQYKTHRVDFGYILSKDSILGTVEGMNVSYLSFKNPGRIDEILVKKGDVVKKGQVLARQSNEEGIISYKGASSILKEIEDMGIDVESMLNDTQKIKDSVNKVYDTRLKMLENDLEKAKIGVEIAKKDYDLTKANYTNAIGMVTGGLTSSEQQLSQAQNAYNMAENNLDNSKILLDTEKLNIEKNALNSLAGAYIIARDAREYVDTILGVTKENAHKNDDYEKYLGAKDPITKTEAERSFNNFDVKYNITLNLYNNNIVGKDNISKNTLLEVLKSSLNTLEELRNTLHDTKDMLDNSIVSQTFNDTIVNSMKQDITSLLSNLESAILNSNGAGVKGSIEAIESFDNNYNLKIKQLEDALKIAEDNLNLAKTGKEISTMDANNNVKNLKTNLSIKEDTYNMSKISLSQAEKAILITKQERESKIAEIDASLSQIKSSQSEVESKKAEVEMNVDIASNAIDSGTIKAPFDGIILMKNFDVGAVVGAGTPIFRISSDTSKYIKVYVDNSIYSLTNGDIVNLENIKDSTIYTGSILNIDNTLDIYTKKNYVEIEITSNDVNIGDRLVLLAGSENAGEKEKEIIIPKKALVGKYSVPGVYVINNSKAELKLIKIISSDEENVSVEGLEIGDVIITEGKDNIYDGEVLEEE